MKTLHLILQGKGGIGKSLTASIIAQYFKKANRPVVAIDADPASPTLSAIPDLDAYPINLMDDGDINPRKFDAMMEKIFGAKDDVEIVFDIGTSSYLSFVAYLSNNMAADLLVEEGVRVLIHAPICGGSAFEETISGLGSLLKRLPAAEFVVWKNEFFGPLERDGKPFEASNIYVSHKDRIIDVLSHPKVQAATFGEDVRVMMQNKMTFDAAIGSSQFNIMARQRLKQIWNKHQMQLDQSVLGGEHAAAAE